MTTPVDITTIIPSKAKTWVGLVGSLLSFVIPFVLQSSDSLPTPWPVLIGAFVAVLTALGIYRAPYKPAGTVLAPVEAVQPAVAAAPPAELDDETQVSGVQIPNDTGFTNPWR